MSQPSEQRKGRGEGVPFDVRALESWLATHVDGYAGPLQAEPLRGGRSNPTWRLRTSARDFVLRMRPGPQAELLPSAHAVEREFRVQAALAGSGVPVAPMVALCEDEAVISRGFYVMAHVEGRVFWDQALPGLSADERAAIYDEMNRVIAILHGLDPAALGLADYGRSGNYFQRQIGRWTRQYQASPAPRIDAMDRLIDWLPANVPADDIGEVRLVHGDFRLDNLIFDPVEPKIRAVIDWELSTLGHPLADFAYHVMSWHIPPGELPGLAGLDLAALGIPGEDAYVARYAQRSGRTVGADWDFCLAYNLFRLGAILHGVAGRVQAGVTNDEHAIRFGRHAATVAALGWRFAERAGRGGQA